MKMTLPDYRAQISKAESTLTQLQSKREKVENLLHSDPLNTSHCRELQKICLDITITENELEHAKQKLKLK